MDLVLWVLFGAITAWIAAIFIGTHTVHRILGIIAVGVLGAVLAGGIMEMIAGHNDGNVNYYSLLLATAGSLLLVIVATRRKV